jgi:hypothetical protein
MDQMKKHSQKNIKATHLHSAGALMIGMVMLTACETPYKHSHKPAEMFEKDEKECVVSATSKWCEPVEAKPLIACAKNPSGGQIECFLEPKTNKPNCTTTIDREKVKTCLHKKGWIERLQ